MSAGQTSAAVSLRFFLPPEPLRPFITTLYHLEISGDGGDMPVEDWLHPEWANLRINPGLTNEAGIGGRSLHPMPRASMTGPTSVATRFRARPGRSWGIGLMPRGWARLTGAAANTLADRYCDIDADIAFDHLRLLCSCVSDDRQDLHAEHDAMVHELDRLLAIPALREDEISKAELALTDTSLHKVSDLAQALGMSARTLERFCGRVFGFSPQLLLRRQRFIRSLAKFMVDPSLKWIETLDSHYHDQAHFVRDFKRFMTMSPSEYAAMPHPVLMAAAHARTAAAGAAMQILHRSDLRQ